MLSGWGERWAMALYVEESWGESRGGESQGGGGRREGWGVSGRSGSNLKKRGSGVWGGCGGGYVGVWGMPGKKTACRGFRRTKVGAGKIRPQDSEGGGRMQMKGGNGNL